MTDNPGRITAPFLDVLEAFLDADGDELHGWAIIKSSNRGGPTVYKILERMAEMGWVTARWDDRAAEPNKPRRRYYRLTGDGMVRARALLVERRSQTPPTAFRPAFGGGHL
jgi:PadR family transcriptional regulator, regulatory protein PadR